MPDAAWPNLPNYRTFSATDHAAHTTPKGVAYPETLMGTDSRKAAKGLMKVATKKHLKLSRSPRTATRRKKKR